MGKERKLTETDSRILAMYKSGIKTHQIASECGVTRGKVQYSLRVQGYAPNRMGNLENAAEVVAARRAGAKYREIGKRFNLTRGQIWYILKMQDQPPVNNMKRPEGAAAPLLAAYNSGMRVTEICEKFNMRIGTVYLMLREAGYTPRCKRN